MAVPIFDFYLWRNLGLPVARTFPTATKARKYSMGYEVTGSPYAPKWTRDLLFAFNDAGYPPDNMKYQSGDVEKMCRLVAYVIKSEDFGLVAVRSALALGAQSALEIDWTARCPA